MANDLIAALATGRGRTAIGILRLSGPGAAQCAEKCFTPLDGKPLTAQEAAEIRRLIDQYEEV